jgi:hypothetical protein
MRCTNDRIVAELAAGCAVAVRDIAAGSENDKLRAIIAALALSFDPSFDSSRDLSRDLTRDLTRYDRLFRCCGGIPA